MNADKKQVGGTHYTTKKIQPWEVIEKNQMGFFDGNALKYLMRWKDKGGTEDLKKAVHYIEKLIDMNSTYVKAGTRVNEWKTQNTFKPYDHMDDLK